MRTRALRYALLLLAILLNWLYAEDAQNGETVFRSDTRLVVLHVTVTGPSGNLLLDLRPSAFRVFENGEPQELKVCRREDVPVSMGLVIDSSASMHDKREKVASAALALVKESNPDDEVFVMNFDEQTSLRQDFTNNLKQLESSLNGLQPHGGTAMRDALRMGIEHLQHSGGKDKKVLVVVTDGDDNASVETLLHLVHTAQQNDVLIYAIGLLADESPLLAARAKRALDALTLDTGGQAYYPKEVAEIAQIMPHIARDIRSQYTLAYNPTNQALDGTFRKIKVEVDAPGQPIPRTRSGYWASVR